MKKTILLTLALGLIMLFSSAALAGFGECSHATQAQRAVTTNDESAKTVAAKDATKAEVDKLARLEKEDLKASSVPKK
jgi:hypothetical protein